MKHYLSVVSLNTTDYRTQYNMVIVHLKQQYTMMKSTKNFKIYINNY